MWGHAFLERCVLSNILTRRYPQLIEENLIAVLVYYKKDSQNYFQGKQLYKAAGALKSVDKPEKIEIEILYVVIGKYGYV